MAAVFAVPAPMLVAATRRELTAGGAGAHELRLAGARTRAQRGRTADAIIAHRMQGQGGRIMGLLPREGKFSDFFNQHAPRGRAPGRRRAHRPGVGADDPLHRLHPGARMVVRPPPVVTLAGG